MSDDLVVFSGRTEVFDLGPVSRPDTVGVDQPIDLTLAGTKLWFTVKERAGTAVALIQKTYVAGGASVGIDVVTTGAKNTGTITIAAVDTEALTSVSRWVWDLLLEESGGRRTTLDAGSFKIRVGVGQPA